MNNIYQSINNVMGDIGAIGKNEKNTQQGFMYRGVDTVMNHLQPLFVKHKIFVVPKVVGETREARTTAKGGSLIYSVLKVDFTFYAEDGSFITATVVGEGMDSGDKASNKALSVAFKYACFQVFCIPTEEMVDPDSESPEESISHYSYKQRMGIINDILKLSNGAINQQHVEKWIIRHFGADSSVDSISDAQFLELKSALEKA